MNISSDQPHSIDAVLAALAPPVIDAFAQHAAQITPLTPAALEALEGLARLQLQNLAAGLRARLTADGDRIEAEAAHWSAVELPHALRESVHRQRHGGGKRGAP